MQSTNSCTSKSRPSISYETLSIDSLSLSVCICKQLYAANRIENCCTVESRFSSSVFSSCHYSCYEVSRALIRVSVSDWRSRSFRSD